MTDNKSGSVITKTNLKFANSDSTVYCLSSNCTAESVFLLPVEPLGANPSGQSIATSNSVGGNVGIGIPTPVSYLLPLSSIVPSHTIQNFPQSLPPISGAGTVSENLASKSSDVQYLYSSTEDRVPSLGFDFTQNSQSFVNLQNPLKIETENGIQIEDEHTDTSLLWTDAAEIFSDDAKNSSNLSNSMTPERAGSGFINMSPVIKEEERFALSTSIASSAQNTRHPSVSVENPNTVEFSRLLGSNRVRNSESRSKSTPRTISVNNTLCSIENAQDVVRTRSTLTDVKVDNSFDSYRTIQSPCIVRFSGFAENSTMDSGNFQNDLASAVIRTGNLEQIKEHNLANAINRNSNIVKYRKTERVGGDTNADVENSAPIEYANIRQRKEHVGANSENSKITGPGSLEHTKKQTAASCIQNSKYSLRTFAYREQSSLLRRVVKNISTSSEGNPTANFETASVKPCRESLSDNEETSMSDLLEPLCKYMKGNKCLLCGFESKAKQPYVARRHLITHLDTRNFECNTCGKHFSTPIGLADHRQKVHPAVTEECVCDECGKTFRTKGLLRMHCKRMHGSKETHTCCVCGKEYASAKSLKVHYRAHTGEKPYACAVCDRRFATDNSLRDHAGHHDPEKRFRCEVCQKSYVKKGLLTDHMNTHKEDFQAFKCDVCGKSFNYKTNLLQHLKVHSEARPHSCETCGMKFKFPHHLRSHIESKH